MITWRQAAGLALMGIGAGLVWWLNRDPLAGRLIDEPSAPPIGVWVAAEGDPGEGRLSELTRVDLSDPEHPQVTSRGGHLQSRVLPPEQDAPNQLRIAVEFTASDSVVVTLRAAAPDLLLATDSTGRQSFVPAPR